MPDEIALIVGCNVLDGFGSIIHREVAKQQRFASVSD
jgi:hypothetical protein